MKILFICRENVGRSQVAEVLYKKFFSSDEVCSAGTKVEHEEGQKLSDRPGATLVIQVMKEKGIDIANNTRKQLKPEMINWADVVISMAETETLPDYLIRSPKTIYWDVSDLHGTPLEAHQQFIQKIENLVKDFIKKHQNKI